MDGVTRFLWVRLKLTVNAAKSAVARPWRRKFLGYSVTAHKEISITDEVHVQAGDSYLIAHRWSEPEGALYHAETRERSFAGTGPDLAI
jgi:hypothetical protein